MNELNPKHKSLIKDYVREARFTELEPFDAFAKPGHFMEITKWYNGEGLDVCVNSALGEQHFSLTWGEWNALQALIGPDEDYCEDDDED